MPSIKICLLSFLLLFISLPANADTAIEKKQQTMLEKALDVNTSRISYARKTKAFDGLIAEEMANLEKKLKQRPHLVPEAHTQQTIAAFKQAHLNWPKHRHRNCLAQAHVQAFPVESYRFETEYFMCTYRQNQRYLHNLGITINKVYIGE